MSDLWPEALDLRNVRLWQYLLVRRFGLSVGPFLGIGYAECVIMTVSVSLMPLNSLYVEDAVQVSCRESICVGGDAAPLLWSSHGI